MNEQVPLYDPGPQVASLRVEMLNRVATILDSGRYILGPYVADFEADLAEYLGVHSVIGVNSGTDALVIALRALDVAAGDEVIVPSFTFFATAEAVAQIGAVPVFADIDPESFNLDPADVLSVVGPATRAVIPVHLFGAPQQIDPLLELRSEGIVVVEDTAQALGSSHKGRKTGTIGDAGTFSFFPSKNLGGFGDGGAIYIRNAESAEIARMLRTHGSKRKYENEMIGYNSRLDELQAGLLQIKLRFLDLWNEQRREVAARYAAALIDIPGILVPQDEEGEHIFHQFTVRVDSAKRDAVARFLNELGISTAIYYPRPLHHMAPFESSRPLPETERACREVLTLPMWPGMPEATQDRVLDALSQAVKAVM